MSSREISFPANFVWGTATAAYQIEGAFDEDGKGESIWDRFTHSAGKIFNNEHGDVACDHYHRWEEDLEIMRQIGLNAYRFSISWPRVAPTGKGPVNPGGLDFYDRLVDRLMSYGIEPYVTLYHWDLPQSLQEVGGWGARETCHHFADYAALMVRKLGDRVRFWTTLNEPAVAAFYGNKSGVHAPGYQDETVALQVAHNLMVAHGMAVQAIRAAAPSTIKKPEVGIALSLNPAEPASNALEDVAAADMYWQKDGRWFLDPLFLAQYPVRAWDDYGVRAPHIRPGDMALIAQRLDFLGVNYYFRNLIGAQGRIERVPGAEYTDMGWEVHPLTLNRLLVSLTDEYHLPPLYVMENGAAFSDHLNTDGSVDDPKRIAYIKDHLHHARLAMDSGVDLRGYFVWTLLDNFEWAYGTSKRFGLVYTDYATQKRTVKASGSWYQDVIKHNGFDLEEQPAPAPSSPPAREASKAATGGRRAKSGRK